MNDTPDREEPQSDVEFPYFNGAEQPAFVMKRHNGVRHKIPYRPSGEADGSWIVGLGGGLYMRRTPGELFWYPFNADQWEQWPATKEQKFFPPAPLAIYHSQEIEKAKAAGEPICIVNDEETADLFHHEGVAATCVAGGLHHLQPGYYPFFKNADITLVPDDNDPWGRWRAEQIRNCLTPVAKRVRVHGDAEPVGDAGASPETFGIALSSPKDVENAYGKFTVRTGRPTKPFWKAWRANKRAMKAAGWACKKDDATDQWAVELWQEIGTGAKPDPAA
jgi:hypothetical protein